LSDPGTGKTLVAMSLARQTNKHLVVIAPNRVHKQWKTEAVKFFGDDKFLDTFYFEQIRTDKGKQELKNVLYAKDCLLVIDESHRIKNHKTKTFKICNAAGKVANRRIIMTGSPIANSPADVWAQLFFLLGKEKIESYTDFCDKYIEFLPAHHPMVRKLPGRPRIASRDAQGKVITKNLDDLKKRIAVISTQVKAEECRDIPEVTFTTIECKLSSQLRSAYNSMEREMMMRIEEELITADNVISMLTRLSMLTSGIATADLGTVFANPKKQELLSILDNHEGVPAIVWTRWKDEYREVLELFMANGYKVTSDPSTFQDGIADIFLSSPASGGTGLNLTRAKMQIWMSRSWSAIERTQALARNNRAGQTANHLHVYDLVAKNTIDERILQALHDKEDLLNTILTKKKL
jgi:SNF2 family DNA or RNA helicase